MQTWISNMTDNDPLTFLSIVLSKIGITNWRVHYATESSSPVILELVFDNGIVVDNSLGIESITENKIIIKGPNLTTILNKLKDNVKDIFNMSAQSIEFCGSHIIRSMKKSI